MATKSGSETTLGSITCPSSILGSHYHLLPGGTRPAGREFVRARAISKLTSMIVLKAPFLPHFVSSPPFLLQFHHGTIFKELSTRRTLLPLPLRCGLVLLLRHCSSALQVSVGNLIEQVDDFVSQTKTVVGHNLEPTPWHLFPAKNFNEETRQARAYKIIQCSYLTCRYSTNTIPDRKRFSASSKSNQKCPDFFSAIHRDLHPWVKTKISMAYLEEAKKHAAFRVIIVDGKLYVDWYYACVQSRAMFTIWGFLQLLKRYPGLVPDVDLMFECMDKPSINRVEHESMPLPLFRYCTTKEHFDIPFPDWSFWGWPEINIRSWHEEFPDIKQGSQILSWNKKLPRAYWKGNPDVQSPIRTELLKCNHSRLWGAQIMRQDWGEAARSGFHESKLSKQCNHRYKIYAEGYAWSVSLKYILSCGSVALIISPQYEDFFSRGLMPQHNFWPIDPVDLCPSIKHAVDWGNEHPSEAEAIGKRGQEFMESLNMARIYDYMFHLISEYAKLQDFKPTPSANALEICSESVLCFADEKQRLFLNKSTTFPSQTPPCTLQPA